MPRTLLLSVPGLTGSLLHHIPSGTRLSQFIARSHVHELRATWPAVTGSVQASLTTGQPPSAHGIVANGLATYRSEADAGLTDPANLTEYRRQVSFWEQSNQFLDSSRIWQGKGIKTAMLFFQHSMPGFTGAPAPAADIVVTPKPEHDPDGKITSLLWSNPPELARELQGQFGPFPLMNYWGPMANLKSSEWIVSAAARVWTGHGPDLQLTYIPHLDYDLQRFGPKSAQAARVVAEVSAALDPLLAVAEGARILILSEYAIDEVSRVLTPNRALVHAGLLKLTTNADGPLIDYANSPAWTLCDHQVGHVFLRPDADESAVERVLVTAGVEVLHRRPVNHQRAGHFLIQAPKTTWLDYRWWSEEQDAPPWATTVDIHRKPGYDPLELFLDPATRRITTDGSHVKGSHGRTDATPGILIGPDVNPAAKGRGWIDVTEVAAMLV